MTERRQRLRRGEEVELESGLKGKLNPKTKTLDRSDGTSLPLDEKDKRDLFPKDEEAYRYALQYEDIKKGTESGLGKFGHQYMQKSIPGAIKGLYDKWALSKPEFQRKRKASQEVSEEISKEHPYISGAATLADVGTDVAATLGTGGGLGFLRGAATGAGLSLAHAGPRMLEEPGQVLGEAGISALGAGAINKFTGGVLNKVAARRGAARAMPAAQEAVRAQNVAGEAVVAGKNAAKLQQHEADLLARENKMIQDNNAYKQAVHDRKVELNRIKGEGKTWEHEDVLAKDAHEKNIKIKKEEYELSKKQHEEALRDMPRLRKEAQTEYSKGVSRGIEEAVETFPKETRIAGHQVDVDGFVGEHISPTAMSGTREAGQVTKILKSLFPESESFTVKELAEKYQTLERAINDSPPAVADYLSRFKEHIGNKLPTILRDNIAHTKIMPSLEKKIENAIAQAIKNFPAGKGGQARMNALTIKANSNLRKLLSEIGPENFAEKLRTGEIRKIIEKGILPLEDVLKVAGVSKKGIKDTELFKRITKELKTGQGQFAHSIGNEVDSVVEAGLDKAMQGGADRMSRLGSALKKTYGMAPNIKEPMPPPPLGEPAKFVKPTRTPTPPPAEIPPVAEPPKLAEPTYDKFAPAKEPQLPPAQGFAEHAGDFLEKSPLKGSAEDTGIFKNPLARLGGGLGALKFLPGAKMGAGAYLAAKGLTSPTAGGAMARMTFRQGGIQAIVSWAQKYPSYHDGVLENPQERRSLTREIEDDPDMPLEQKAIIQSKVNRGKPLEGNLH
jgi:hypothetical protein